LLDWGFLGQVPALFEALGLVCAVIGVVIMSIGDEYIIKPLFASKKSKCKYFHQLNE
jgi:drug/metabolite transporter (DMT)-like permease